MFVYWMIYFMLVFLTLFNTRKSSKNIWQWFIVGVVFVVVIGFRDEVGCDWFSYVRHYQSTLGLTLSQVLIEQKDIAHAFINWIMGQYDGGIYSVNFIYALIFVIGLLRFARAQIEPWLVVSVAVPYMIIVVVMGYSRQGVALGLFMLAITYLQQKNFKAYIFWVLIAALFHKTAIVLLPFGLFLSNHGMKLRLLILMPVFYGGWDLLLAQQQEQLWDTYISVQMHSSGAKIRVLMNFIPAILFFVYRKKWKRYFDDYPFWFWVSVSSIVLLFVVGFATTAVDRISLYLIPLQLIVYSRLPFLMQQSVPYNLVKLFILLFYTAVLFVWLNFATHASCWLPYHNVLLGDIV